MSLKLLLAALQTGRVVTGSNALIQIVHECTQEFAQLEKRDQMNLEFLKQLLGLLEERLNERLEGLRACSDRRIDVIANALERLETRVHGPGPSPN